MSGNEPASTRGAPTLYPLLIIFRSVLDLFTASSPLAVTILFTAVMVNFLPIISPLPSGYLT